MLTKKGHLLGLKHLNEYQNQSYMGTVLTAKQTQLFKMLNCGLKSCLPKILLQLTQTHVGIHKQILLIIADLQAKNMK